MLKRIVLFVFALLIGYALVMLAGAELGKGAAPAVFCAPILVPVVSSLLIYRTARAMNRQVVFCCLLVLGYGFAFVAINNASTDRVHREWSGSILLLAGFVWPAVLSGFVFHKPRSRAEGSQSKREGSNTSSMHGHEEVGDIEMTRSTEGECKRSSQAMSRESGATDSDTTTGDHAMWNDLIKSAWFVSFGNAILMIAKSLDGLTGSGGNSKMDKLLQTLQSIDKSLAEIARKQ